MNLFRPQKPYVFCPPKYARWFKPVMHWVSDWYLRRKFNVQDIAVHNGEALGRLARDGHSILVTPNHADHADPALLVHAGKLLGIVFQFMAAREAFERGSLPRLFLQKCGAFSVDREGQDISAIKTAMSILVERRHPLVIFPEGEIYHHQEELDILNDGVATILLRAAVKVPENKSCYAVPTAIRVTHDPSVSETFGRRLDRLERHITWKPRSAMNPVERIYRLGGALISIKEEEFMGQARQGTLVERISALQRFLVEEAERKHGLTGKGTIPARIKMARNVVRRELIGGGDISQERRTELYDDLDRIFVAQQLYSYPGQYLRTNPTINRIAETIMKLEEDLLEIDSYPAPRRASVRFGEPIDVKRFLEEKGLDAKSGVGSMTELLRESITGLMRQ